MAEVHVVALYRAAVHYEEPGGVSVRDFAFDAGLDLEVEGFDGCPAASPYVTAEGEDLSKVLRWATAVKEYAELVEKNT